jgi:hypothetical protein
LIAAGLGACSDAGSICQQWGCADFGLTVNAEFSGLVATEMYEVHLVTDVGSHVTICGRPSDAAGLSCEPSAGAIQVSEHVVQFMTAQPESDADSIQMRVAVVDSGGGETQFLGPESIQLCLRLEEELRCSNAVEPSYSERRDPGCKTCEAGIVECRIDAGGNSECHDP